MTPIFEVSPSFLESLPCARRVQYSHVLRRVPEAEHNGARFGKHIHSALHLTHRLNEHGLDRASVDSAVAAHLQDLWATAPTDEGDFRTMNWAQTIYSKYQEHYRDINVVKWEEPKVCRQCGGTRWTRYQGAPVGCDHKFVDSKYCLKCGWTPQSCLWCQGTGKTSQMSEVTFGIPLGSYGPTVLILHGIIDLLVHYEGHLWVLDYKTTSRLGGDFWDTMRASPQLLAYVWAASKLLSLPIKGYIVRAIRTKEPPQWVKETPESRSAKTREWWRESLGEQRFDVGPGELDEWHENALVSVRNFLRMGEEGFYPQSKSLCVGKYGKCAYYDVCQLHPASDRVKLLASSMFVDKTSPLESIIEA